eukprot:UN18961
MPCRRICLVVAFCFSIMDSIPCCIISALQLFKIRSSGSPPEAFCHD